MTISGTVTSIEAYAFSACYYLAELNYLGTVEEWNSVEKGSNWKSSSSKLTSVNCSDGTVTL